MKERLLLSSVCLTGVFLILFLVAVADNDKGVQINFALASMIVVVIAICLFFAWAILNTFENRPPLTLTDYRYRKLKERVKQELQTVCMDGIKQKEYDDIVLMHFLDDGAQIGIDRRTLMQDWQRFCK